MSFSIEFYATDKKNAIAEILRLQSADAIPIEVATFLLTGVRNLRAETYDRREDSAGKYIGGKLVQLIHVKAVGHLCNNGSNSYEVSTGNLTVDFVGPVV